MTVSLPQNRLTNGLRYSLATGNWGKTGGNLPVQPGVSQMLQRLTYASTLSHLRRGETQDVCVLLC